MTARPGTEAEALRKTVTVPQEPADAFALFVDDIGTWWPLRTHSVGLDDATGVVFEHGEGGRIVESIGGDTAVWGTVTVWDPPARVRFTWHPGRSADEATDVEVTFRPVAAGTEVELVHTGWNRRADGPEARAGYETGWDLVLGRYASVAGTQQAAG
jgi:uncharacterized protein YndB with AHSA1/START domain